MTFIVRPNGGRPRRPRLPVLRPPRLTWLVVALVLVALASSVWLGLQVAQLRATAATSSASADLAAAQRNALAGDVDALREQVEGLGEAPVAPPASVTVEEVPGPRGATGATGSTGPTGAPGATGSPGATGAPGADGSSVIGPAGPQGEPGTSVVGPAGPQGEAGTPGRGIAALTCVADDSPEGTTWRVAYTDGEVAYVTGPCRYEAPDAG